MALLEFFVVPRSVAIDQTTNVASVLEILEAIPTPSFPLLIPQCVAMSLWREEPGDEDRDFQLVLRITTPSNTEHVMRTNFRMTNARHRVTQRIQGLPIESEGQLRFEAILNDQHAAEHVVDIQRVDPVDSPAQQN